MEFYHISPNLNTEEIKRSVSLFTVTMVELGVRKDNRHVGTARGGNNFQLLSLFGMRHRLSDRSDVKLHFNAATKTLVWGGPWLFGATRIQVRDELDTVFNGINEAYKYESMMLSSLAGSDNLRKTLASYKEHFPELMACLAGNPYQFAPHLNMVSKLILASALCQELASELDQGNTSNLSIVGKAISQFPPEIILLSVRMYITIERLVRFDMDEHPDWLSTLTQINTVVERGR